VTGHEHLDAVVDVVPVDPPERRIPFRGRELVHAQHQVLVALLGAIAGEVLDAGNHFALSAGAISFDIGAGVFDRIVGIGAIGACVDDGVAPVEEDIHTGIEVDVDPQRAGFPCRDVPGVVGDLGVAGGLGLRAGGDVGAVCAGAVAAGIAVGCDEQGDLRGCLQGVQQILTGLCLAALPTRAADVVLFEDLLVGQRVAAEAVNAKPEQAGEQLAALFFRRHGCQGVFDPLDLVVRQVVWHRFEVYKSWHEFFSLYLTIGHVTNPTSKRSGPPRADHSCFARLRRLAS